MTLKIATVADVSAVHVGIALKDARTEVQVEALVKFALLLDGVDLTCIAKEVHNFAGEDESKALCRLARALNERDAGPSPLDPVN
jgi:hypothetical protein